MPNFRVGDMFYLVGGFNPMWKILVKLDHLPNFRGKNKKSLKPPPSDRSLEAKSILIWLTSSTVVGVNLKLHNTDTYNGRRPRKFQWPLRGSSSSQKETTKNLSFPPFPPPKKKKWNFFPQLALAFLGGWCLSMLFLVGSVLLIDASIMTHPSTTTMLLTGHAAGFWKCNNVKRQKKSGFWVHAWWTPKQKMKEESKSWEFHSSPPQVRWKTHATYKRDHFKRNFQLPTTDFQRMIS